VEWQGPGVQELTPQLLHGPGSGRMQPWTWPSQDYCHEYIAFHLFPHSKCQTILFLSKFNLNVPCVNSWLRGASPKEAALG
jgi:hypothetical protein